MLAMSAFKSGQCDNISAAAKAYNVSKSTLFRRIHRRSLREHFTPTNKKLSKTEEEVLIKDILKLDSQGLSPSLSLVRDIADTISKARGGQGVEIKWL
jgi:transposase-like protein